MTNKRSPIVWPACVIGTISECDNSAICAVSKKENYKGVGVDVKDVLPTTLTREIWAFSMNKMEVEIISSLNVDFNVAMTIAMSAKDAFQKCLRSMDSKYSATAYCRFKSVDSDKREYTLESDFCEDKLRGRGRKEVKGQYYVNGGKVYTLVAI
ncbi:hypothetical protein [Enterovibrio nigricans]|nr:hypothetical protein [Enterovibrio nigricans]PKF48647.1 hypothetical protein AT251_24555 [Enterovibrio nigricans]